MNNGEMLPIDSVITQIHSAGLGFDRIEKISGSTYKDNSTIIIIPTRGTIHYKVVQSWQSLIPLMNQKRAIFFAVGHEVSAAYNTLIQQILADSNLIQWKYILTLEDDNIVPADAHIRLLEAIDLGFDAVSGIYFTKGDLNMPMCYGNADEFRHTGVLEFRPRDIAGLIKNMNEGGTVVECNGIAMGCALWKMELFRNLREVCQNKWFCTVNDIVEGKGAMTYTQDLYFCEKAKRIGKKFAVDLRVRVGHIDPATGIVY